MELKRTKTRSQNEDHCCLLGPTNEVSELPDGKDVMGKDVPLRSSNTLQALADPYSSVVVPNSQANPEIIER